MTTMQKRLVIIIFLICFAVIMIMAWKNTMPDQKQVTTTIQTPVPTKSVPVITPIITVQTTATPLTTINVTTAITAIMTTTPQNTQTVIATDNPIVSDLKFTKNFLYNNIHNCEMQEIFPSIAKDPNYGLKQTPPRITSLSIWEYNVFLRDYIEGKNENQKVIGISRCAGLPTTPDWNFIEASVTAIPTNGRPANYTISLNIRSQGKIVAQFRTTERLTQDQTIRFTSYIPLKIDEMDFFEGVEVTFTKLPN